VNLFVLSLDPDEAAEMACDQHVVKMPTETAQMLSTVVRAQGIAVGYRPSHAKHPCTLWLGASKANFDWALRHGFALCDEYERRYHRTHGARKTIFSVSEVAERLVFEGVERTPFALAMPEEYRGDDPVEAYRRYYHGDKAKFARWVKNRPPPGWWKGQDGHSGVG
jgi:hypothetical protein